MEVSAAFERSGQPWEEHETQLIDSELPSPNFFVVGAAKAGTTSLHAYLRQHPEVFMPEFKEPHFFSTFAVSPEFDNFQPVIRDSSVYQELFRGSEACKAVGEASPSYLCDSNAAMRIKSAIPDAKIIISLRNPVERAYSHYLHEFREGRELQSFREALELDQAREEKGWGVSFQYVELGLYADQVERYLNVFGRSNVLVILFEDLIRETAIVLQDVARFLDVDPGRYPDSAFVGVHNPFAASRGRFAQWILRRPSLRAWSRRCIPRRLRSAIRVRFLIKMSDKPQMDESLRGRLAERFAPDLRRLEQILERDLGALRHNS